MSMCCDNMRIGEGRESGTEAAGAFCMLRAASGSDVALEIFKRMRTELALHGETHDEFISVPP